MNRGRMSTNIPPKLPYDLDGRIQKLLMAPSNYIVLNNGKIKIKSSYTKKKPKVGVKIEVSYSNGELFGSFNSITECAEYFKSTRRIISNRLKTGKILRFENNNYLLRRVIL